MSLDTLPAAITLLIILSVATERVVEIVKSLSGFLTEENPDSTKDRLRRAVLHLLGVASGVLIAWLTWPVVAQVLDNTQADVTRPIHLPTVLALGLLASGGSGFWNTILTHVLNLKELKKTEVRERKERVATAAIPQPSEGQLVP